MDTNVLSHGNLYFTPDKIIREHDGNLIMIDGVRIVAIYVIYKNVLNVVKQMYSLEEVE